MASSRYLITPWQYCFVFLVEFPPWPYANNALNSLPVAVPRSSPQYCWFFIQNIIIYDWLLSLVIQLVRILPPPRSMQLLWSYPIQCVVQNPCKFAQAGRRVVLLARPCHLPGGSRSRRCDTHVDAKPFDKNGVLEKIGQSKGFGLPSRGWTYDASGSAILFELIHNNSGSSSKGRTKQKARLTRQPAVYVVNSRLDNATKLNYIHTACVYIYIHIYMILLLVHSA